MNNTLRLAFTSYLSHLAAYVCAGATVVSTLDPSIFPPKYAFVTAVAAAIAAAFSHGKQVGVGQVGPVITAAANAVTKSLSGSTAIGKCIAPMLLMLLALPLLHGCASASGFFTSPSSAPFIKTAVDIAVATAEAKGISPVTMNTIAHKALDADQNSTTSLAAISAVVQSEIQLLKLTAADQAAADILLAALSASIQTQLTGADPVVGQVQAAARVVIQDVIDITGG